MAFKFYPLTIEVVREIATWDMAYEDGNVDMSAYEESYTQGDVTLKGPGDCLGYGVSDDEGKLVGLFEFYARGKDFEIGLAIAPLLRGKGMGASFVNAGVEFGVKLFPYAKGCFLEVSKDNHAALAIYRKADFFETHQSFENVYMKMIIKRG